MIPAWCALALDPREPSPTAICWLLTALAIVWAADTGAYFAGRQLAARRKLAPRISPNKTIEGLLGGVVAGVVGRRLFGACSPARRGAQLPRWRWWPLVAVLFSVVGDLFESLLKRHVGAKDSGNLIPGHGGILDRIDGVLAALPVFALGKDVLGF